ncbi:MAG TPA: 16S rRNA (guanine(966)-N(2))-methyltransferase RsmD [Dermatophilaceae bacterium]|nr:16S rRNA (guanine(966)-N(2))-methyltransferase RsmD [Dermatophilaceae bacterium]
MTRIISGLVGGRRLQVPPGAATRPTSDRVREGLFSRLEHLDALRAAHVLDLYAGSGALGLEAASRGAAEVLLVDSSPAATGAAAANVAALGLSCVQVRRDVVEVFLAEATGAAYDLVLADPPYSVGEAALARVLALLVARGWLAPSGLVVVERSARSPAPGWPSGLELLDERRYGETRLWFAERGIPAVA